jgi:glyoxylase-like metal-dependent hydrolase (beta-lactamase superfamily II)
MANRRFNSESAMKLQALITLLLLPCCAHAARIMDPRMPEKPRQISQHVYEIESYPNVGIIVGRTATLVVDTGLGPRNGAIVAQQARKLSKGRKLYLVTTHFHPEHAAGDGGFPAETILVRSRVQQKELESDGDRMLTRFRSNPAFAEFLPEGITFRTPNQLFDKDMTLDLGGVHARIELIGPTHTVGDQLIWIPEDQTLFTGDLAMKDDPPRNYAQGASREAWITALDRLAAFRPLHVVPDHGEPGDIGLIQSQREFLVKQAAQEKNSVVPLEQASYHVPVLRNDYVTVIHVDIPGKHASGYHTHSQDQTCVVVEDYPPEAYSQPLGGPPGQPRRPARGEVSYVSYFNQPPVTHQAVNPGTLPMRQICAELNRDKPYGFTPQARDVAGYTQKLDNDRVRAWTLMLAPGQTAPAITQQAPGMRVVVQGGDIAEIVPGKGDRGMWLRTGNFYWQDAGATRAVRNVGTTTVEIVEFEVK